MKNSHVYLGWAGSHYPEFRAAVSLHGHTFYSLESLDFIERATANTPWLSGAIRKQRLEYRKLNGCDLNFKRAWWTPPLSPQQAWTVEKDQIERVLGKEAYVSLTDHDNIQAGMSLRVLEETRTCPVSVEWTVPFRETFFHIGIHNLPVDTANVMMSAMTAFTAAPDEAQIAPLLEYLGASQDSLIVLNHPSWDESHAGEERHTEFLIQFLTRYSTLLHGLELNGLRPGGENRKTARLAERFSLPVVSGGDRHAREPNACVNLTNASSFAEFAGEVRRGASNVLFLPQYRESLKIRIVENIFDVLEDDPNHALGWNHWSDRVFYQNEEGAVRSLHQMWGTQHPAIVNRFVSLMGFAKWRGVRSALRLALTEKEEFAL